MSTLTEVKYVVALSYYMYRSHHGIHYESFATERLARTFIEAMQDPEYRKSFSYGVFGGSESSAGDGFFTGIVGLELTYTFKLEQPEVEFD